MIKEGERAPEFSAEDDDTAAGALQAVCQAADQCSFAGTTGAADKNEFIFSDVEGNVDEGFFETEIMVNVKHPNDEALPSGVNHSSISWPIAR